MVIMIERIRFSRNRVTVCDSLELSCARTPGEREICKPGNYISTNEQNFSEHMKNGVNRRFM